MGKCSLTLVGALTVLTKNEAIGSNFAPAVPICSPGPLSWLCITNLLGL